MDHINVRIVVLKLSNRLNLFSSTSNEVLMTSNEVFKHFRGSSVDRKKAGKREKTLARFSDVRGRSRPLRRGRKRSRKPDNQAT